MYILISSKRCVEIAKFILKELNKSETLIRFVKDRPGHDFRYSLNCGKIRALGWVPKTKFEEGLKNTILWYLENKRWWEPLLR